MGHVRETHARSEMPCTCLEGATHKSQQTNIGSRKVGCKCECQKSGRALILSRYRACAALFRARVRSNRRTRIASEHSWHTAEQPCRKRGDRFGRLCGVSISSATGTWASAAGLGRALRGACRPKVEASGCKASTCD